MSFWDDLLGDLGGKDLWSSLAPAAITAGAQLAGGIFQSNAANDQSNLSFEHQQALQAQSEANALKLEQMRLAAAGANSGAARSAAAAAMENARTARTSRLLDAYQQWANSQLAAQDRRSSAYQDLIKATQGPLGGK